MEEEEANKRDVFYRVFLYVVVVVVGCWTQLQESF